MTLKFSTRSLNRKLVEVVYQMVYFTIGYHSYDMIDVIISKN